MPDGKLMEIWEHLLENQEKTWMNIGSVRSGFIKGKNLESHLKRSEEHPHIGEKDAVEINVHQGMRIA